MCAPQQLVHGLACDSIGHSLIGHKPFTALEQRKTFRHRSLWLVAHMAQNV